MIQTQPVDAVALVDNILADAVAGALKPKAEEVYGTASPAMRLASALLTEGRVGLLAIGEMLDRMFSGSNPEAQAAMFVADFEAEYYNKQADPDSKGAKSVRAARKSELKTILATACAMGCDAFQAAMQPLIDAGTVVGLQSMAKAARALARGDQPAKSRKPRKDAEPAADGSEDFPVDPLGALLVHLRAAQAAAVDGVFLSVASQIRAIIEQAEKIQ